MAATAKRRFCKNTLLFSLSVCLHGFVAVLHEIGFLVEMLAITLVTSQSFEVCAKQRKFILNLP